MESAASSLPSGEELASGASNAASLDNVISAQVESNQTRQADATVTEQSTCSQQGPFSAALVRPSDPPAPPRSGLVQQPGPRIVAKLTLPPAMKQSAPMRTIHESSDCKRPVRNACEQRHESRHRESLSQASHDNAPAAKVASARRERECAAGQAAERTVNLESNRAGGVDTTSDCDGDFWIPSHHASLDVSETLLLKSNPPCAEQKPPGSARTVHASRLSPQPVGVVAKVLRQDDCGDQFEHEQLFAVFANPSEEGPPAVARKRPPSDDAAMIRAPRHVRVKTVIESDSTSSVRAMGEPRAARHDDDSDDRKPEGGRLKGSKGAPWHRLMKKYR